MIIKSREEAKWIMGLILYFTLLISINSAYTLVGEGDPIDDYKSGILEQIEAIRHAGGSCDGPRSVYRPSTGVLYDNVGDLPFFYRGVLYTSYRHPDRRLNCENNIGSMESELCYLEGCSYNEISEVCEGDMNTTYYEIEWNQITPFTIAVAPHDNSGSLSRVTLCNHPSIIYNVTDCIAASCTWNSNIGELIDDLEDDASSSMQGLRRTFSFRFFIITGISVLDYILNTVFVLIPTILFAVSLYYMFNPFK